MMGITLFILIIGRLGTDSLAATNIAFNVNTIAFMPMIGLGITVSVLVGQYLGMNNPERAEYSVYSGLHLAIAYMGTIALLYVSGAGHFHVSLCRGNGRGEIQANRGPGNGAVAVRGALLRV